MEPKTGMLAKRLENGHVQCHACSWRCRIAPGNAGVCGVRANEDGELHLMVYGKPCAIWADPIEKKPLFHFLPGTKSYSIGTYGCNFSCQYCQNWDISQAPHEAKARDPAGWRGYFQGLVDKLPDVPPETIVDSALKQGCESISFTYNEPTIFTEYALDIMELALKKDLKGVYVTNGYETKECWDRLNGYIHAANIDLKAYNERFYKELCHVPGMAPVKESIRYAKEIGIWVEVTTLLIPGWNDDAAELEAEAKWLASVDPQMPWHVTAFHPDYKMLGEKPTPPEILIKAREIGIDAGLKHVYCGNIPYPYSSYETTICPHCGRSVIRRSGFYIEGMDVIDGQCRFCRKGIGGVWE